MGDENLCAAYYEQPELVRDILDTISKTNMKVFERIFDFVTVDNLTVHEDMAGKNGPLAGPAQVREFIAPYYLKIWNECRLHGTKLFSQDSDGNMNDVIDAFIEAGVNVMYPFEPNSGMDMVKTRKKYGKKLAFKGGMDKFALLGSKDDVERELKYKICEETLGGGTVFALDHRIPNGVPIENYRHYAKLGKKLLGHAPESGPFVRMAF
jgi:uroporphyrinogen-III decarboxylase